MKKIVIIGMSMMILLLLLFLVGCSKNTEVPQPAGKTTTEQPIPESGWSDAQVLQYYPDDLDNSVKELDEVG